MFEVRKNSLVLLSVVLFTGCGSSIKLAEFKKVSMPKSKFMPSQAEMQHKKSGVIVVKFDENEIALAKQAKLGNTLATQVDTELSKTKMVNIIKRVKNTSLTDEIKASEIASKLGVDVGSAQYLITGKISNASYTHSFTEASSYQDKKGRIHRIPASHKYKGCSVGNIKIYGLPTLNMVQSIPFNNCRTKSEDARSSTTFTKRDDALVRKSAVAAINSSSKGFKNFFAAKGYIFEKRTNKDEDSIVKVTIGSKTGAKKGEDINFYTKRASYNELTGKTTIEIAKVGTGVITNEVYKNECWIKIKEINEGEKLKLGDFTKIKYATGTLTSIVDAVSSF